MPIAEVIPPFPNNHEGEDAYYLHAVSHVLNIPTEDIDPAELYWMMRQIRYGTEVPNILALKEKYLTWAFTQEEQNANYTRAQYPIDGLTQDTSYGTSFSTFAPFYLSAIEQNRQTWATDHPTVLLAGAMCSVSMNEFTAVMNSAFPQINCITADTKLTDKPQHSTPANEFQHLDLLQMTYTDKFDAIFSSSLLNFLLDPHNAVHQDSPKLAGRRRRFFRQAKKALKPGGTAIMVEEILVKGKYRAVEQPYIQELRGQGFKDVREHKLQGFITRRLQDRFVLGNLPSIPEEYIEPVPAFIGITATK